MQQITAELLRELLDYDPATGALQWKARAEKHFRATPGRSAAHAAANWNARYAGKPALAFQHFGYLQGRLFDRPVKAHRAAFCIVHGHWPEQVDHINGDRADNRIANLREVNDRENRRNAKLYSNNPSGVPGVTWDKARGRWQARCARRPLGRFDTFEEAVAARREAEAVEGFHPNNGRI